MHLTAVSIMLLFSFPMAIGINITDNGNQKDVSEMKKNLTMLQDTVLLMNATIKAQNNRLEETQQKNEAYQLILKDLVATFDALRNSTQQELNNMNKSLQYMASQLHYTTLSFFDLQKTLSSLQQSQQETERNISSTLDALGLQGGEIKNLRSETERNVSFALSALKSHENEIISLRSDTETNMSSTFDMLSLQEHTLQDLRSETERNMSSTLDALGLQGGKIKNLRSEAERNVSSALSTLKLQENEIISLRSDVENTIAFTVSKTANLELFNFGIMRYDKIIINKGGAFNSNTSIFTCPVAGTYVFTWSAMSKADSQSCELFIVHNGNTLMFSYSHEGDGSLNEVSSNTIILHLEVDDRVWVKTQTAVYCFGYPYTGFSGWKL